MPKQNSQKIKKLSHAVVTIKYQLMALTNDPEGHVVNYDVYYWFVHLKWVPGDNNLILGDVL